MAHSYPSLRSPLTTALRASALLIATALCTATSWGQGGANDPTFNIGSGFTGGGQIRVLDMTVQDDDAILVSGVYNQFDGGSHNYIIRLNADGSVDPSFQAGATSCVSALAVLPDQRIMVAGCFLGCNGTPRTRVALLLPNGALDATFDPGEGLNVYPNVALAQPDGKVIIGGFFNQYDATAVDALVRVDTDGGIDSSFAPLNWTFTGGVNALALQADGKVVVGGNAFPTPQDAILRFHPDGTLDNTFNTGGVGLVRNSGQVTVRSVLLQPDGKIVLGGMFDSYNGVPRTNLLRLNPDGQLDNTFNAVVNNWSRDIALDANGRIVICGTFTQVNGVPKAGLARLNSDGSVDLSFDPGAGSTSIYTQPTAEGITRLALQQDGRLIVGGQFTAYNGTERGQLARVFTDLTCIPTQLTTTPDPVVSCGALNLTFDGTSTIAATEVPGANMYQFRFTNTLGQPVYARNIAFPTRSFTLTHWATKPLKAGRTYNVVVRASFDNGATWCDWGPSCTVKVSWTPLAPVMARNMEMDEGTEGSALLLYPNPNNTGQLHMTITGLEPALALVSMDVMDVSGRTVLTRTLPVNDGYVDQVFELESTLTSGLYTVRVTGGDALFVQQLVVQR